MAKPLVNYAPVQLVLSGGSLSFTPTVTQGTGLTWTAYNPPTGASVNSSTGAMTGTLSTLGRWITELVGRNAYFAQGEADSGSTTTAVDSSLSAMTFRDDLYNKFILFTSGSNAGVLRKITRYNDSTKTITFDRATPASVAAGDDFDILGIDDFFVLAVPTICYSSVVTVDAAWLADSANQHDDGWKIEGGSVNNSHKIFRLAQNVTSTKTAFWIADEYVYIDLNGYAIHYGSANGAREYGVAYYTKEFFTDTTYVGVVQTPEITNRSAPQSCAIFNGSIINDGSGDRTHAIGCHRGYDLLVAETVVDTTGKDSCAINVYSSGHVNLLNNDFTCDLTDTFDRHAGPSIVQLNGTMLAEGNAIKGQNSGFNCLTGSVARRNFISHAGAYTNGYAFFLYRTFYVEVYENIAVPTNGRGVLINGGSTPATAYNSIVGNLFGHLEVGNGEFGNALQPPAYRSRYNTNANVFGDNHTLGIGGGSFCGAAAIYLTTYGSDDGEEVIAGNNCDVITVNRSSVDRYANSITFEGTGGASASSGGLVLIKDNVFRSNCYHIRTEGYDGFTQQATPPNGNTWEKVDGTTALGDFFDAVDAMLLRLGMKSNALAAAQDQRDVAYAIYDEISGVSGTLAAFWYVKHSGHDGLLSFCDMVNGTFGTGVDPKTYSYEWSTLSTGSARYRSGDTAEITVLHTLDGLPVENADLVVTTPQGDEYTITTDANGVAEFTFYDFAITKVNASGQAFVVTDRTFSIITQGEYSAIVTHASVPGTITLELTPPTPPINTVAPAASGTPTVGQALSCTTGTWDNSPDSYAYQWYQNTTNSSSGGSEISGATSSSFLLTSAQVGKYVYCEVDATNEYGTVGRYSNVLGSVQLASSYMTIAHIASTSAGSTGGTTVTTSAIDTTGADFLVVAVSYYGSTSNADPALSDSKGNTWTALTARELGFNNAAAKIFYCKPTSVGSGHTFTADRTNTYPTISVSAFSGVKATSPFDQESGTSTNSASTSYQPGSITPSEDGCLLVTGICSDGTSHSVNSSFNATATDVLSSNHMGGGIAYKVQTTAGAENPTWSWTGSTWRAAAMASFKAEPLPAPSNSVAPAVIGLETEGETLETDNGTWTDASSYSYKWFRNASESTSGGTEISGATSATYDLTASDVDKYVYSQVTATNITGSTSAFSNIVGPIADSASTGLGGGPLAAAKPSSLAAAFASSNPLPIL